MNENIVNVNISGIAEGVLWQGCRAETEVDHNFTPHYEPRQLKQGLQDALSYVLKQGDFQPGTMRFIECFITVTRRISACRIERISGEIKPCKLFNKYF